VSEQSYVMTKQQFDAVVDDAIREGKQLAFAATLKWLDDNTGHGNGLSVELSTGLFVSVEDVRQYLTEAPTWPENAR